MPHFTSHNFDCRDALHPYISINAKRDDALTRIISLYQGCITYVPMGNINNRILVPGLIF